MINKTLPNVLHPRVSGALQAILILMVVPVEASGEREGGV
jgi:hypothetical protein